MDVYESNAVMMGEAGVGRLLDGVVSSSGLGVNVGPC